MENQNIDQGNSNTIKDPENWTTGNEPATRAQLDYLKALGENIMSDKLTKAEASRLIDELKQKQPAQTNQIKNPEEWNTGDQSASGAQKSYLKTLANEAGEIADTNVTKAEAAEKIEELQKKTGRADPGSNE